MNIGQVADPPFAILPDPAHVFAVRSERFAALARGHELEGYLGFLAALTRAQHEIIADLPAPQLPAPEELQRAREHAMPPLSIGRWRPDEAADATFAALLARLASLDLPEPTMAAIAQARAATPLALRNMMEAVLLDAVPEDEIAGHVLAAAAIQVHYARLASLLDAKRLAKVADGACPACGGMPVASQVVGWEGASNTRFCYCSICSTQWHVVRVKCLLCGADKGLTYQSIEGSRDTVKAEACAECRGYVKILHQHREPAVEPFADDVATLALDLLMRRESWQRRSANPFLLGY